MQNSLYLTTVDMDIAEEISVSNWSIYLVKASTASCKIGEMHVIKFQQHNTIHTD